MCVIINLKKHQIINYEMLKNACFNNWHSFGLVIHKGNTLDVIKEVPESGELDSAKIFDLLMQNKDYDRFLHLRHNTAGATDERNAHPMTVYKGKKRHVEFMHNGTLYEFKSKIYDVAQKREVDVENGPSDTRNFVDQILAPFLSAMDFGNGPADIENFNTAKLIRRFWVGENRGVLISSDQKPLFIGDWKTVDSDGTKITASNDTYFNKVVRGPEFIRRELQRKNEEDQNKKNKKNKDHGGEPGGLAKLSDFQFEKQHSFYQLSQSPCDIINDWDFYDREHCVSLGYMTKTELEKLHEDKEACVAVMDYGFTDYLKLFKEYEELEEKQERATKIIATLMGKLKDHEPDFRIGE